MLNSSQTPVNCDDYLQSECNDDDDDSHEHNVLYCCVMSTMTHENNHLYSRVVDEKNK